MTGGDDCLYGEQTAQIYYISDLFVLHSPFMLW